MAIHSLVPLHAVQNVEREVWSATLEGTYEECVDASKDYAVGNVVDIEQDDEYQTPIIYTALQVSRKEGLLGELTYSYSILRKHELWSLDMTEVTKDILTWLVTPKGGMTQAEAAVAIAQIRQWQAYKDAGAYMEWENFQYNDDGATLEGAAKTVAEKMMKGVESYTIFLPVITRTTQWSTTPPMGKIGFIDSPEPRDGWKVIGGTPDWASKSSEWLKTAERSSSNGDGTYTFVEQWTGYDQIDGDLYPSDTTSAED